MSGAAHALAFAVAGALTLIALASARDWLRDRPGPRGSLALGVGLLALVAVTGRVQYLTGYRHRGLVDVSVVAFLGSGYALLAFRHAMMPLRRRTRLLASAASVGAGALALGVSLPASAQPSYSAAELAAVLTLVLVWVTLVGEPVVRFWVVARRHPPVQRARLRSLAAAYAGIIAVLLVGVSARPEAGSVGSLVVGSSVLSLIPLLYASLAPPPWLRRAWRRREETALRAATQDLVTGHPDQETLASTAVDWAVRLVGAGGGFIIGAGGRVLAARGADDAEIRAVALELGGARAPRVVELEEGSRRFAIAHPLGGVEDGGLLVLLSGPFTPILGSEEVDRLGDYATVIAAGLERVRLTEALRRSTGKYGTLVDAVGDLEEGIVAADAGGKIVYANEAFCAIVGRTAEELAQMPSFRDLVAPDQRPIVDERFRRRIDGEDVIDRYETAALHSDGRRIEMEIATKLLGDGDDRQVVAIVRDVTARKRSERALRESEERFRRLAENAQDVIFRYRLLPEPRFEFVSPAVSTLIGYTPEECYADPDLAFKPLHPEDRERVLAHPPPLDQPLTLRYVHRDGHLVWTELRMTPIYDDDGNLLAVEGITRDISARVRAEEEHRRAEQALREAYEREREAAEHLRALDEMKTGFLTAVSHELRTPLTSVLGFALTLQRQSEALKRTDRDYILGRLAANARKLDRLLGDLLDLDRLSRGVLTPRMRAVDLSALVLRVAEEADVGPHPVSVGAGPLVMAVDAPKVERIVENLLVNAAKHTPPGTRIWIRLLPRRDGIVVAVEDEGAGIPDAERDAIFELFRRGPGTPEHSPGAGVGLTVVARFAELHGGRAWVEDRPGGGASFRVFLAGRVLKGGMLGVQRARPPAGAQAREDRVRRAR